MGALDVTEQYAIVAVFILIGTLMVLVPLVLGRLVRPHLLELPGYEPVEPVDVVAQRCEVAREIEAAKRENDQHIICQRREAEELAVLCDRAIDLGVDPDFVISFFHLIIGESIKAQLAQREAADDR